MYTQFSTDELIDLQTALSSHIRFLKTDEFQKTYIGNRLSHFERLEQKVTDEVNHRIYGKKV